MEAKPREIPREANFAFQNPVVLEAGLSGPYFLWQRLKAGGVL